jgi:MFS family permease
MLALGAAMTGVVGYGGGAFLPSFFFRNHGEQLAQLGARFGMQPASFLGVSLGLAAGVAGILGTLLGGKLADRFGPRNARAYALIPAGAALVCFPFYIYAMLTGSVVSSILAMGLVNLLITVWSGPVYAAVQGLVQSRTRATAVAVLLLMINLVGLGLGPLLLGIVSDFVSGSLGLGPAEGVRWAQVAITLAGFGSAACFWAASSTISAELRH